MAITAARKVRARTAKSRGATNPNFANVVLQLHCEGANNGTTITDSSSFARAVTLSGTVKTTTESAKYGTSSVKFLGGASSGAINIPNSSDLIFTGDYTLEFWVYIDTLPASSGLLVSSSGSTGGAVAGNFSVYLSITGAIQVWYGTSAIMVTTAPNLLATGTWYKIGITRETAGLTKLYINDSLKMSATSTIEITNPIVRLGNASGAGSFKGKIDEVRLTKGVVLDLTIPQTEAYPDA